MRRRATPKYWGSDSLEGLGLEVDPTSKRLKKVETLIAY